MNPLSHTPLYIQVKESLLHMIQTEKWTVDTQIPSEKELMTTYKVGRETVRKAVAMLVQEGYLIKRRGIGTFVQHKEPSIGFEPLISLSHMLQMRGLKDHNVVRDNRLVTLDEEMKALTKMNDENCRYINRLRFVDGKLLAREYIYLKDEAGSTYDFSQSISKYLLQEQHKKIHRIEQVITVKDAGKQDSQMLELSKGKQLLILDRWIYVDDIEEVCFYIRFMVPSDIYNLALT